MYIDCFWTLVGGRHSEHRCMCLRVTPFFAKLEFWLAEIIDFIEGFFPDFDVNYTKAKRERDKF